MENKPIPETLQLRLAALRDRSIDTNDTERRTESLVRVQLTNDELLDYAKESADAQSQSKQLEADLSHVSKTMKAKIEAQEAIIDQKSNIIRNGYEPRMVECVDVLDHPRRGKKTTFRLDTLEAVDETLMTDGERQRMLKFEETQEEKAKTAAAEALAAANQPSEDAPPEDRAIPGQMNIVDEQAEEVPAEQPAAEPEPAPKGKLPRMRKADANI